jgi:predicted AAA+ superfamily ATPase
MLPFKTLFINADEIMYREILSSQSLQDLTSLIGDAELLIFDEAQRVENIGINLKLIVDNYPGLRVIATGSASFELANRVSEPLTGRKLTFSLYPVSYSELVKTYGKVETLHQLDRWLIWGGYPEIVTTQNLAQRERLMGELVSSYLYRDILELEDIRHASKIVDLLRLLAFQIGSEVSISELASNLSSDFRTIQRYLDLLEKVFVIYRVGGFSRNLRKEITKNARYYFFDNGVRNSLVQNFNPLKFRDDIGQLWENFLMIERRKINEDIARSVNSYFWRTYDHKEIDYIEEQKGRLFGYEFKYGGGDIRSATKREFLTAYPGSELSVIDRRNFVGFVS